MSESQVIFGSATCEFVSLFVLNISQLSGKSSEQRPGRQSLKNRSSRRKAKDPGIIERCFQ